MVLSAAAQQGEILKSFFFVSLFAYYEILPCSHDCLFEQRFSAASRMRFRFYELWKLYHNPPISIRTLRWNIFRDNNTIISAQFSFVLTLDRWLFRFLSLIFDFCSISYQASSAESWIEYQMVFFTWNFNDLISNVHFLLKMKLKTCANAWMLFLLCVVIKEVFISNYCFLTPKFLIQFISFCESPVM